MGARNKAERGSSNNRNYGPRIELRTFDRQMCPETTFRLTFICTNEMENPYNYNQASTLLENIRKGKKATLPNFYGENVRAKEIL